MFVNWCLNFASRSFVLFNFCLNWIIYSFNARCSSIITPRYLVRFLGMIFCPLRQTLRSLVICFEWDLNITISVLLTFGEILLALSHWTKLERSWLIFLFISFKEELTYKVLVSSAKWCTDENIIPLLRSLIYIRNSRGPNFEPWGKPNSIIESSDCLLLTVVNCCLFVK